MPRKASRRPARTGQSLQRLNTADLRAELNRRARSIDRLVARRDALRKQLEGMEKELAAFGHIPVARSKRAIPGGRKRPRNDANLEQSLAKVLKGKTMGVTEVAQAVQKSGYRTTSPNFRTIVNQALLRSALIKKVARGSYTAA